jgi:hypothetical protein
MATISRIRVNLEPAPVRNFDNLIGLALAFCAGFIVAILVYGA